MKYIIEFEDEYSMNEGGMKYHQCKQVPYWSVSHGIIKNLTPYTEPDRKAIEDEVWEFMRFIAREMDAVAKRKCFGEEYTIDILGVLTFQEAKAKYEAWKKQKDETFDTGDEVYDKEIASKGVILRRYNSDTLDILWDDGSAGETIAIKAITKTGRHFPEVAELLEKMRGDSDDKD